MQVGKVEAIYSLPGRGLVIVLDTTYAQLPSDLHLKIGDPIEFRSSADQPIPSRIAGIEHSEPWTPMNKFAVLVPAHAELEQIQIGTELWKASIVEHPSG